MPGVESRHPPLVSGNDVSSDYAPTFARTFVVASTRLRSDATVSS